MSAATLFYVADNSFVLKLACFYAINGYSSLFYVAVRVATVLTADPSFKLPTVLLVWISTDL